MKVKSILLGLLFSFSSTVIANPLTGIYVTKEHNTLIEVSQNKEQWQGVIIASDNAKAPIGKVILSEVVATDTGFSGQIYSLKRESYYDVELTPEKEQLQLEVSVGFFSKTLIWQRLDTID
ncbi:DUF2147 domain-containing protein [Paraferrimonas sp. SM1919]|uniref:DUF2147 domain-containing protein n=1 Tax=Paraferrimonas sp. SM1919 TaxID=2662263 RepID=UPI0013D1EB78|nr:DUF2147 domain-containing protein [Paraferrimonas sp. SM1919]